MISRSSTCLVAALFTALIAALVFVQQARADRDLDAALSAALKYLRAQQNDDGSFGKAQARLQTAVAILAIASVDDASASVTDRQRDAALLSKGAAFLLAGGSLSGDMGDDSFRTESHAMATAALLSCVERLPDAAQRESVRKQISRAVNVLKQNQDRSMSSAARGGWKMEGSVGNNNDRRASGWAMLALTAAKQMGLDVRQPDMDRGAKYMMGAFKAEAKKSADGDSAEIKPEDVGGLSVDESGLTVETISAMGGWTLARVVKNPDAAKKNLAWLTRNQPGWTGPNYFYANFFRARAVRLLASDSEVFAVTMRRLSQQIKDHQQGDGSIGFPPGEAQNEVAMGGVFPTAMSVLILNTGNSRLPFDEDFRVKQLF